MKKLLLSFAVLLSLLLVGCGNKEVVEQPNNPNPSVPVKDPVQEYNEIEQTIEDAALNYSTTNDLGKSEEKNGISLDTLQKDGFLEESLINPITGYELGGCVVYYWNNTTNRYIFEYDQTCENYSEVKPSLTMNYRKELINENGWAKEDVDVTLIAEGKVTYCLGSSECTPNLTLQLDTGSISINKEGTNYLCAIASNNLGSTSKQCISIKLDKTAPTAGTATFTGTLGSNNWYTSDVKVYVKNGSDELSGHDSTVSNVSNITTNTNGATIKISTTDLAGNTSTRDYTVKVDKSSPTIVSKSNSIDILLNESNVIRDHFTPSFSISGGTVTCSPTNTTNFNSVGTYKATCTANGGNGKTASASISVRVLSNALYDIFIKDAVADNTSSTYVSSSRGINFSLPASSTNGQGVYRASSITSNPIYYYRGNVSNNNVIYANYCWKMVITTADRGVKLIYNGVPINGTCNNTNPQIGTSVFNSVHTDNAYIGYMYGSPETSTVYGDMNGDGKYTSADYLIFERIINGLVEPNDEQKILGDVNLDGKLTASDYLIVKRYQYNQIDSIIDQNTDLARYNATHKNRNNSTIKSYVDSWYRNNMTSYTDDLEDAIWCNDRSLATGKGYGDYQTIYSAAERDRQPSLTCTNTNDRFTVSTSNGNGALTYPVGLLTYDEYILAGKTTGYLNSGSPWWTLTPSAYDKGEVGAWNYISTNATADKVTTSYSVRPAIVLKYGIKMTSGSGTTADPFIVD